MNENEKVSSLCVGWWGGVVSLSLFRRTNEFIKIHAFVGPITPTIIPES